MTYGLDRASFNQGQNAQYDFSIIEEEQPTLTAKGPGAVCSRQSGACATMITKASEISMSNSRSTTIIIEHHPNDSRTKIADDQKNCQGLTSSMGTGGGNVPLILERMNKNDT